jgi:hypothetical protein
MSNTQSSLGYKDSQVVCLRAYIHLQQVIVLQTQILIEKVERKRPVKDLVVDGRIILK